MMEPILGEFEELSVPSSCSTPNIPYVANLTGEWVDGAAPDAGGWSRQLRSTVRFADGLNTILDPNGPAGAEPVLLEVGPGRTLVTFARRPPTATKPPLALPSLPGPDDDRADTAVAMEALGSCGRRRPGRLGRLRGRRPPAAREPADLSVRAPDLLGR